LFIVSALTHDFRVSKGHAGGSHARAVLRTQRRQLVAKHNDALSSAPLHAFGEHARIMSD